MIIWDHVPWHISQNKIAANAACMEERMIFDNTVYTSKEKKNSNVLLKKKPPS